MGRYLDIASIIKEAELENIDINDVNGDTYYLYKKNMVDGIPSLGQMVPRGIMINENGIDTLEDIVKHSFELMSSSSGENDEAKKELQKISLELQPTGKIRRLFDYIKKHPELVATYVEKTK